MRGMNKRAQFFILSAVIIAAIIVSMASVKNYVITGNTPKDFYEKSQRLESEAGIVVDYDLYNSEKNLSDFLNKEISFLNKEGLGEELFVCYAHKDNSHVLVCQNNGSSQVNVSIPGMTLALEGGGGGEILDILDNQVLTIKYSGKEYKINLGNLTTRPGQFYFVFRMNKDDGEFYDVSGDIQKTIVLN